jgi:putative oxidoreductase
LLAFVPPNIIASACSPYPTERRTYVRTELLGGLAVLLGAFVALASVPLAAVMLVALSTVHWQFGFSSVKLLAVTAAGPQFGKPSYEVALLYLACLATLVLGGPGSWAVANIVKTRRRALHVRDGSTRKGGTGRL